MPLDQCFRIRIGLSADPNPVPVIYFYADPDLDPALDTQLPGLYRHTELFVHMPSVFLIKLSIYFKKSLISSKKY